MAWPVNVQQVHHAVGQPVRSHLPIVDLPRQRLHALPPDQQRNAVALDSLAAVASAVTAASHVLTVIRKEHPHRPAAQLARQRQGVRYHSIVVVQGRVVVIAKLTHPPGSPLRLEVVVDLVLHPFKAACGLAVPKPIVGVRADQVQHNQLARCGAAQRLLKHRQTVLVQRAAATSGLLVEQVHLPGQTGMFLLNGHIVLIADPPGLIAGGGGQGQQMLPSTLRITKVEKIAQRRHRRSVDRPSVFEHPQAVGFQVFFPGQLRAGRPRIAIDREVFAVDAFAEHQHHGLRTCHIGPRRLFLGPLHQGLPRGAELDPLLA